MRHRERHRPARIGWLRAAVLGADDGIVSTASLLIGVAAAGTPKGQILIAGIAGLVAGAMSMAAGEYVSVSSQVDSDEADLARERRELATDRASEQAELAHIYVKRGVQPALAQQVADQLMAHDALGAQPEMSSASPTGSVRVPCRQHSRRRRHSRSARPCRCWSPSWRRPLCWPRC
jgi:VIT1/CCC1 family predicted Fe2+/Mn2+ transporter